jgi:hypothetical protein
MRRIALFLLLTFFGSLAQASDGVTDFQFGILKARSDGSFVLQTATTKIPRRLKDTGFRFGMAFQNARRQEIEWHEVIYLPEKPSKATGTLRRVAPTTLKTVPQQSNQASVVDDFWFDNGDPLGKHKMELVVNGKIVYEVEFEVIE